MQFQTEIIGKGKTIRTVLLNFNKVCEYYNINSNILIERLSEKIDDKINYSKRKPETAQISGCHSNKDINEALLKCL